MLNVIIFITKIKEKEREREREVGEGETEGVKNCAKLFIKANFFCVTIFPNKCI